jgi:hypothetical protein
MRTTALSYTVLSAAVLFTASCSSSSSTTPDTTAPAISSVTQNRSFDPTGLTVDVLWNEAVEMTSANTTANYTVSVGTISSATLQPDNRTVRLVMAALAVPGDITYGSIAAGVTDTTGNELAAPITGVALVADDTTAATAAFAGVTVAGANNDQFTVLFGDTMIETEVEDVTNWTVESPVGTAFDLTNATFTYVEADNTVTVDLGATVPGISGTDSNNLQTGEVVRLTFTGVRDLSGNDVAATATDGVAAGDNMPPTADSVWADGISDELTVRFSEPVKPVAFGDLYTTGLNAGARFHLTDQNNTVGVAATGSLTITGDPVDAETFALSDGTNTDTYEWESAGGVTGGNIAIAITTGNNNAMATSAAAAIVSGTVLITPVAATNAVNLTNDATGVAGNVTITGTVTNVSFVGMAGGVDQAAGLGTVETTNYAFTADNSGVLVDYDVIPIPGTDTMALYGFQDLAGNHFFATTGMTIASADVVAPVIDAGNSAVTAVAGETNDTITVRFNKSMSPFNISNPANYTAAPLDLSNSTFSFNGTNELSIALDSATASNVQSTTNYSLTIVQNASTPLYTEQGVVLGANDAQVIASDGDTTIIAAAPAYVGPTSASNTCIVVYPEAPNAAAALTVGNYAISATNPTAVTQMTPRAFSLTFATQPAASDTLTIEVAAATDLGGNAAAGQISSVLTAVETTAPTATFTANAMGDRHYFDVIYSESVDQTSALTAANYSFVHSSSAVDFTGATWSYDSTTFTVHISLAAGTYLDFGETTTLAISSVTDLSGNALAVAPTNVTVIGDSTAPAFTANERAFLNLNVDALGYTIDVQFEEAVEETFVETIGNWTTSGSTVISSATLISPTVVRIVTVAQIGTSETLDITGVLDVSGNASGALSSNPLE